MQNIWYYNRCYGDDYLINIHYTTTTTTFNSIYKHRHCYHWWPSLHCEIQHFINNIVSNYCSLIYAWWIYFQILCNTFYSRSHTISLAISQFFRLFHLQSFDVWWVREGWVSEWRSRRWDWQWLYRLTASHVYVDKWLMVNKLQTNTHTHIHVCIE